MDWFSFCVNPEIKIYKDCSAIFDVSDTSLSYVNQATNYFKGEEIFGDIITVNLTCMMVLSALYISVSKSLPTTPSIKYVEIWLLFSLIYPFLIVIIQTWIQKSKPKQSLRSQVNSFLPAETKPREKLTAEIIAKYFIPGFGILFSVFYFSIGIYQTL